MERPEGPLHSPEEILTPMGKRDRSRRIAHNFTFLALSDLVGRLSTWGLVAYLGRHWTVSLYGEYSVAVTWVGIFAVLGEFGLNALAVREVAHRKGKTSFYLRHVMVIRASFSLLFWGLLIGISLLLRYEALLTLAMAVMGLRLILDSLEGGYIYLFQAHQDLGPYSFAKVLGALVRFVGIILMVWAGTGLVGASSVWTIASGFSFLTLWTWGSRRGWKPAFHRYRLSDSWGVLRMAIPLATFGALQTLYYRVDAVILKSLSGNEAVGFYDMATKVLIVVLSVSQLYSQAVFPVFASLRDKPRDFGRLAFQCSKVLVLLGLPMTVGGFFLAEPVLRLVGGPQYGPSGPAFAVLALSILPFFVANIYVDVLAVKNTARLNLQFVVLFVLNVLLNFLFIPRWQFVGAAWATVFCEYAGVLLGFYLAAPYLKKMGKVPWQKPLTASTLACGIMGLGLFYFPHLYWLLLGPIVYAIGLHFLGGLDGEDRANLRSILRISN